MNRKRSGWVRKRLRSVLGWTGRWLAPVLAVACITENVAFRIWGVTSTPGVFNRLLFIGGSGDVGLGWVGAQAASSFSARYELPKLIVFPKLAVQNTPWPLFPRVHVPGGASEAGFAIPTWQVGLAALGATVVAWRNRPKRIVPHGCARCGYSRDGLQASAACPECGAADAHLPCER